MEQVSDLPNVRFYTANEDIQAGGLATVGIDGIVRAATSPRTPLYRGTIPSAPNRVLLVLSCGPEWGRMAPHRRPPALHPDCISQSG